ncbi:hypothetical protein A3K86_05715 [Photobacterium jeanii]|uniref:Uncharacterized protein n=1 Tax=Photobacterium jeanii TaxID=858640 RepID=A0A178KLX3_9GAMM|nr:hypothetical protein A3K86_05715 [Photobacterium jeanii]PST91931.1 hypothetical protein C9I91_01755 [Photobacterium jeanii]
MFERFHSHSYMAVLSMVSRYERKMRLMAEPVYTSLGWSGMPTGCDAIRQLNGRWRKQNDFVATISKFDGR